MDMKLFRQHLAQQQNLTEGHPELQSLAYRVAELPSNHNTKSKILDEIDQIWSDLDYIRSLSSITKRKIQSNLDELTDAIKANDYNDADILRNTIIKDLLSA
jgi:hypothetical protein